MCQGDPVTDVPGTYLAREQPRLSFSDIYAEEELAPARCCTVDGKQISEELRNAIIKAVFSPLHARA